MRDRWLYLLLVAGMVLLAGCGPADTAANGAANSDAGSGAAAPAWAADLRGAVFDPPRALEDFSLMSTTGEPFTLSAHQGQIILLYFGYLTCPDICPTTFAQLRRVYLDLDAPADQVKVVFVTVDPERDDLDRLTQYTHAFHQDFLGLRGEGDTLEQVKDTFGVVATRREVADSQAGYLVDHTASIFLIGADGRLQAQYLYGTDYQDIVHDVQLMLQATR